MRVTVTQGTVTVRSVDLVYDTPDIKVLEVHTDQKHPVPGGYSSGYFQVIESGECPDELDDALTETVVHFVLDRGSDDWCQVCTGDRYHLTVVLFRYRLDHDHRTEVYRKEDSK